MGIIRLTESQLRRIIRSSVRQSLLREIYFNSKAHLHPVLKDGAQVPSVDQLKEYLSRKSTEFDDMFEIWPDQVKQLGAQLIEVVEDSFDKMNRDYYYDSGAVTRGRRPINSRDAGIKEKEFCESLVKENAKTLKELTENFLLEWNSVFKKEPALLTDINIRAFALCAMDYHKPNIVEHYAAWIGFFPFEIEEIDRS